MTDEYGVYKVVIRTRDEAIGKVALESARDLVMSAINDRPYDVAATVAAAEEILKKYFPDMELRVENPEN